MRDGFIRTAAATPKIKVADPVHNRETICRIIEEYEKKGAELLVFPELCLSGYTCNDLFQQEILLEQVKEELKNLVDFTKGRKMLLFAGLPWEHEGKLYNVAAAICDGELLGLVTKTNMPNYSEFYELRHFTPGMEIPVLTDWLDTRVPMGTNLLFTCKENPKLTVAAEICEDVWVPCPPSIRHALAGATVIVNCSASDEVVGKDSYRRELICGQSARLICGYVYANAGEGESTQDLVFGGHNIIAENGTRLAESGRFVPETVMADMDLERLNAERRRTTTYPAADRSGYQTIRFSLAPSDDSSQKEAGTENGKLLRYIDNRPFVPHNELERSRRCEEIFTIQAMGLKKRLEHTGCSHVVLGISGGLDSTLALLVCVKTFDKLGWSRKGILGITMPGFGTTDRTYHNAVNLMNSLGISIREISIKDACIQHFKDIDHDVNVHDVTYENSQARERTQILMDIANQTWGMVVGTGDLSELALGWATYNGDHMSMYGVNAGVPKTLVKYLVQWVAKNGVDEESKATLLDIVDTPISPELIPADENGDIKQKTEDLVGPYELHDFFLYYFLRFGFRPSKIYYLANIAFGGVYDEETIKKWLSTFFRRFFNQQFKRSCLPDGPKVGSISISPRGDWRMPSDASFAMWLKEIENL